MFSSKPDLPFCYISDYNTSNHINPQKRIPPYQTEISFFEFYDTTFLLEDFHVAFFEASAGETVVTQSVSLAPFCIATEV